MKYHLIAIGGSVMHNVALDLHDMGHEVTGSDDEIYEPSRSRLAVKGLLPETGWDENRVDASIDAIILGKHAKIENPELKKAQALDIPIYSFPEYVSKSSKATKRVAIAGSHGKTSTTAMIMHVLKSVNKDFDYLVGANLEGFEKMVKLSDADILIVEADEYPSSCIDLRAKMLHYSPTISVITGLAWDHVNIYKTYDSYKETFLQFLRKMEKGSICFFDQSDEVLLDMMLTEKFEAERDSYVPFPTNKKGHLQYEGNEYPIKIFGRHNLLNLNAAFKVCLQLDVKPIEFLESIQSFKGASKRLEVISENENQIIYKDFAHAPSKAKATMEAVRSKYPNKRIRAILELHTFSSLTASFIKEYNGSLAGADSAAVYFDPHAVKMKGMAGLDKNKVLASFGHDHMVVLDNKSDVEAFLSAFLVEKEDILLIMSSGNLGGIDLDNLLELGK